MQAWRVKVRVLVAGKRGDLPRTEVHMTCEIELQREKEREKRKEDSSEVNKYGGRIEASCIAVFTTRRGVAGSRMQTMQVRSMADRHPFAFQGCGAPPFTRSDASADPRRGK